MSWTTVCDLPMDAYQANQTLDTTDFHNDANILGGVATHPGFVTFQGSNAQLEVLVRDDSLARFAALRVQALVRPRYPGVGTTVAPRYNIVEGWMSFAFVIQPGGRLTGTIYDGHNWIGPDSGSTTLPHDVWSRVSFEYDGINIAKLTLNGSTVGTRLDMPVGMRQPQHVITLGHWPRGDDRYTLQGDLGHVRIERRDYEDFWRDAMHIAFCRRRLTPLQADARREIEYLVSTMEPSEREKLRQCARKQSELMREFLRKLRLWNSRETARLRLLAERLRAAWCCAFNAPAARDLLLEYFRSVSGKSGSEEEKRFQAAVEEFFTISAMCTRKGYPYDRIRELCLVLLPEFRSFETDLREIVKAV